METTNFGSFKPIIKSAEQSRQNLLDYYTRNGIEPSNPLMERFLQTPSTSIQQTEATPVKSEFTHNDIRDILAKAAANRVSVNPPLAPTMSNVAKEDRHLEAMKFFVRKGFKKEWAAGIASNLFYESSFDTTALGDQGSAFGLAQWRGSRRKELEDFAKSRNTDPSDFETQLEFIYHELNNKEKDAYLALQSTNNPRDAAKTFSNKFERPRYYDPRREDTAESYYVSW